MTQEQKIDAILKATNELKTSVAVYGATIDQHRRELDAHNTKIQELDAHKNKSLGIFTVIGVVISAAISVLISLLKN